MAASKDIAPKNQPRQGTRQESFESRGKRGSTGSLAQTRAAIYGNPLPLYVSQNEQLSLLWSLTWALSLSCQVLAAQLKSSTKSRNRVSREAYLEEKIQGYWDEHTKSVWVLPARQTASKRRRRKSAIPTSATSNSDDYADASTSHIKDEDKTTTWMDSLWKRGFFGKGSLSRSEPTWWQREKNRVTGEHVPTAEDITSARRAERMIVKKQKAQERAEEREKQVLALAEKRKGQSEEVSISQTETPEEGENVSVNPESVRKATEDALAEGAEPTPEAIASQAEEALNSQSISTVNDTTSAILSLQTEQPTTSTSRGTPKIRLPDISQATAKQDAKMAEMSIAIPNLEHTQLQREEAFFLVLSSGALEVYRHVPTSTSSTTEDRENKVGMPQKREEEKPMLLFDLWKLFAQASLNASSTFASIEHSAMRLRPDNPFIVSYVVYHHYRSLGWVVRNGVKFCVDWVLYKGADGVKNPRGGAGPVGGHAEFAVAVIPTYEDTSDAPTSAHLKFRRDWRWLNTVNRVNSGVKKTVILTFVTIPRMCDFKTDKEGNLIDWLNPGCLKHYSIKEVSIKRFIPTRMRD